MTKINQIDAKTYERDAKAALDRELAVMSAQSADLDQRLYWFTAAGQMPPPQLLLAYGDGLAMVARSR